MRRLRSANGAARRTSAKSSSTFHVSSAGHRDDLLRQHVERIARIARGLDLALVHRARDGGAGHQIAAELRKDDAFADGARLMAGAADALQAAGDRRRRLDLHDQIDGAHVDAELERRGGDERLDAPGLEQVFDLAARLARQRAVVRAHQRLAGQLVERAGQPLGQPPAVDEEQRRPVRADQLEQPRMNRRPDRRRAPAAATRGPLGTATGRPRLRHVLDRHLDAQLQRLLLRGVDDGDRPDTSRAACVVARTRRAARPRRRRGRLSASACRLGVAREARAFDAAGASTRRRRETAPPRRAAAAWPRGRCAAAAAARRIARRAQRLEPLERQRQVRAALAGDERVDLVDDDRVDASPAARARCDVSSRNSDSGVVIRMSAGSRRKRARSLAGVSPVRMAIAGGVNGDAGARRRRWRCRPAARAGCARRPRPAP